MLDSIKILSKFTYSVGNLSPWPNHPGIEHTNGGCSLDQSKRKENSERKNDDNDGSLKNWSTKQFYIV